MCIIWEPFSRSFFYLVPGTGPVKIIIILSLISTSKNQYRNFSGRVGVCMNGGRCFVCT